MLMDSKSSNTSVLTDHSPVNESKHVYPSNKISSGATISPDKRIVQRKDSLKLDDVRSNGWLDAMKCSSPPRKKTCKDSKFEVSSGDSVCEYFSWMVNYPSALNSFERIMDLARNKKIVMFLDYDGTLSPIVDDPDSAFMSDEMRTTVMNIANYIPTAIISGRSRDKVYKLVGLTELYYAGSHGMDIMFPVNDIASANLLEAKRTTNPQEKEANIYQPAINFIPMIDEVFRTLVEHTSDIQGAKVENHKFCASVHYRNVDEKNWPIIGQRVHDILKDYPRLRTTHGRKVLEVRPVIDWDKGKAVEFFLESLGLNNRDDVLPIYIGDDKTDEDAFKVLRDGNRGFGILVTSFPKETNAFFSLRDPLEVQEFLSRLCDGNRKCGLAQSDGECIEPTAARRSSA